MQFVPPRCPRSSCEQHTAPAAGFYRRRGFYYPACRDRGVQRFLCRSCRKTFSEQAFRHDYRDRRPDLNARLFQLLSSGVGFRQSGRVLGLKPSSVQRKARKIGRTCQLLHDNLSVRLPGDRCWLLDEEETYEGASIRPLTMPVLIEKETWFVVGTAVGSIRRLAPLGTARRERQDRDEAKRGVRPDQSAECVRAVLETLAQKSPEGAVLLRSDKKSSYGAIAKTIFGSRLRHETTSGEVVRNARNPLFPINTTLAMSRDNCGRLRRKSWLVTKVARWLQNHLAIFTVYRNYVRRRFNRDKEADTPARILRLLPRNLEVDEVLRWRQDWGERSIHPLSFRADRTVHQSAV